ncbi:BIR7A-like protein [Mya arenaria]|uniref:BIR7A-like protein n=1 Tax=Mya arenaria TaxID=6604 RepID=A0ABY7ECH7_MYAAR|nr:baculoviral IAP repeat-containing protein 7-like [Mya arenaria]WAR07713.1 BIR7A-like protein [Mya arenaria]
MYSVKRVLIIIFLVLYINWSNKNSCRDYPKVLMCFQRRIYEQNTDKGARRIGTYRWKENAKTISSKETTDTYWPEFRANMHITVSRRCYECVGRLDMLDSNQTNRSRMTMGLGTSPNTLMVNNNRNEFIIFVKGTFSKLHIASQIESAVIMLCFCYAIRINGQNSAHMDNGVKYLLDNTSSKIVDIIQEAKRLKQQTTKYLYMNSYKPVTRQIKCFPLLRQNLHMEQEWNRLVSFNNFPEDNSEMSFIRLSQSGFFYTGERDIVECFSCGVKNNKWPHEVSVADTHRNISPDCAFMTGKDESNIPIHPAVKSNGNECNSACSRSIDEHTASYDETHEQETAFKNSKSENHPVNHREPKTEIINTLTSNAKYPEYAIKRRRYDTFHTWAFSHIVPSQSLVECGLFHTGVSDCVRCFSCGGGMRNWEHGDDPWIEHARWFPNCQYVKQCKGQGFIDACLLTNGLASFGHSETAANQRYIDEQTLFPETVSASTSSIVPIGNNENRTLIKELQEMGFSESLIDEALLQLSNTTDSFLARKEEVIEYLLTSQSSTANHESEQQELSGLFRQSDELNSNITDREGSSSNIDRTEINQKPEAASSNTFKAEQCKAMNGLSEVKQKLSDENELLKQQMICKVCMDNDACMVFLPCGHMVTCTECAHALRKCAICRSVIKGTVRTFMS